MRSRRALLYMPGDDMHKIRKATSLGVDCICMDTEDGVANNRKSVARATIAEALQSLQFGNAERLVRINPVGSGLENEDLSAVLPHHPDGIVIPKISSAFQIQWVSEIISKVEQDNSWANGSIYLIVIIETAQAIINLPEIVKCNPRLQALIFGADDLAADIGATRTAEGWEVFYARSAVVLHAAAYGLQAIDLVNSDFRNIENLKIEALQGARMGFSGKQIIHPNQINTVQEAFTPTDEAVKQALLLVDSYEKHLESGIGAFALEGRMIDAPIIKAANNIIARARAAGKI